MKLKEMFRFSSQFRTKNDLNERHETELVDFCQNEEFLDAPLKQIRFEKEKEKNDEDGFEDWRVNLSQHRDRILPVAIPDLVVLQVSMGNFIYFSETEIETKNQFPISYIVICLDQYQSPMPNFGIVFDQHRKNFTEFYRYLSVLIGFWTDTNLRSLSSESVLT